MGAQSSVHNRRNSIEFTNKRKGRTMTRVLLGLTGLICALAVACGGDDNDGSDDADVSSTPSAASPTNGGDPATGVLSSTQLPIAVTVPAGDDFIVPQDADTSDLFAVYQPEFPNGYVDFLQPTQVYAYATATESELSGPPADYVQWFNALPFPSVVDTQEVTVGGVQGTRLKITNGDSEDFALFRLSDGSDYELDYLGNGAIVAYMFDVSGTQVVVICGTENASNFGEFETTCDDVLTRVRFGD